ncbi:MAG: FtsX-like permease family protein [Thermoanaerobaculia bacterium]
MKLVHHLRLACKVLLRRKGFTAISLFTIAATLLVVSTCAAFLDVVFGTNPPESRLDRAVGIMAMGMYGPRGGTTSSAGYGFLDRYMRDVPGVEEKTFFSYPSGATAYVDGRRVRLMRKRTDGSFWRVFDLHFLEGGPFTDEDERDHNFVAVVNAAMRDKLLGSGPAVGRWIEIEGQRFRVVGVVDNVPIVKLLPGADVWVPLSTSRSELYKTEFVGTYLAIFVARSRSDLGAIRAEIGRRILTTPSPNPDFPEMRGGADTKFEAQSRMLLADHLDSARPAGLFGLFVGAAVLFMLLPAVNLINLNASRVAERATEIGVRRAFGAPRRALLGQFLLENLVLSLAGGAIGFMLSTLALAVINASGFIPYLDLHVNFAVAGWTFAGAVVFGLLSGLWPAYRMSRISPIAALAGGPR